jgi:cytochrome c556
MSYRFRSAAKAVMLATTLVVCAAAFAVTPAETQKVRHQHYEELGDAFKAVRDLTKSSPTDFAALEKAATTVNEASINQIQWFPKGTGPEAGKTRALPDIWAKPTEFTAAMKMFEERAPALLAATKSKDLDAVTKAFREVGGACKNCHDSFRAPE